MNDENFLRFIDSLSECDASVVPLPDLGDELLALAAEAIGWTPLAQDAYLHIGTPAGPEEPIVIEVVGSISADMASSNILLLT